MAGGLLALALLFVRSYERPPVPLALTLPELGPGSTEHWAGVYVGDQKIGTAVTRELVREDKSRVLQERNHLSLVLLGAKNDLTLATDLEFGADDRLNRLVAQIRTEVQGLPVTLRAEGQRRGDGLRLRLFQAGEELTTLDLEEIPAIPTTLYRSLRSESVEAGQRFELPYFSPLTLGEATASVEVLGTEEAVLPDGSTSPAIRLRVEASGQILEALVADGGRRIWEREVEGGLGMRIVAETQEQALNEGWPADGEAGVDLIALSSVPLDGRLPGGGRSLSRLVLGIEGVDRADALLTASHGEAWDRVQGRLLLERDQPEAAPSFPLPSTDRGVSTWLRNTAFIPSDDPEIRHTAGRVLGETLDATGAARKLSQWVYRSLEKVPVAGVPQAKEVLNSRRGDCNEHTALYTALARSVGLPTRMAAGLVYSEALFSDGAFYYHAWPEVWLGDRWVAVDPTFGQFPADATHLKLVEGDLSKQLELMGVIGRIRLKVLEVDDA